MLFLRSIDGFAKSSRFLEPTVQITVQLSPKVMRSVPNDNKLPRSLASSLAIKTSWPTIYTACGAISVQKTLLYSIYRKFQWSRPTRTRFITYFHRLENEAGESGDNEEFRINEMCGCANNHYSTLHVAQRVRSGLDHRSLLYTPMWEAQIDCWRAAVKFYLADWVNFYLHCMLELFQKWCTNSAVVQLEYNSFITAPFPK